MAELKKCAACGCTCGGDEEEVDAPTPEDTTSVEGTSEEGQIKSFRLHRHSNDTEFAVLLALVPAMTMTLFNLMGLL